MSMKIIPVTKTIQKSTTKIQPKSLKTSIPKMDLSCEELGFFRFGDKVVPIIFPR